MTMKFPGVASSATYIASLSPSAVLLHHPLDSSSSSTAGGLTSLHPSLGGSSSLSSIARTLHNQGIRLILELDVGSTGTGHEWFRKSVRREPGFEDFYLWKGRNGTDTYFSFCFDLDFKSFHFSNFSLSIFFSYNFFKF